jgi:hypothetical protein
MFDCLQSDQQAKAAAKAQEAKRVQDALRNAKQQADLAGVDHAQSKEVKKLEDEHETISAAQAEAESQVAKKAKIETKRKKIGLLKEKAMAQIKEADYYAAAATLESALAGRKYLEDDEVKLLEEMAASAEKQGEAKQICLQGSELIMAGREKAGLKQYAKAIELDPENESWPVARDAALEKRRAAEEVDAGKEDSAKGARREAKAAEKAAKQAVKRDKQVERMTKNAGIQLKSQKYEICTTTCAQALGMIDNDDSHPSYQRLVEMQKEADDVIKVAEMKEHARELIHTQDYSAAQKLLEEAIAVNPNTGDTSLREMFGEATVFVKQQDAERKTKLAQAKTRKKQQLAKDKQAQAAEEEAAEVAVVAQAPTTTTLAPPTAKARPVVPESGLGSFMCDNDINVKGAISLGKVQAELDLLITAFGDPKDTVLAGVDWHIMGAFDGKNLIAQVTGTEGSKEWSVKGMRGTEAVGFIQAIIELTIDDLDHSHVPTDAATGMDAFRVDNEINIKMMREVGGVDGSYNMLRYTFGPPKEERNWCAHLVAIVHAGMSSPCSRAIKTQENRIYS